MYYRKYQKRKLKRIEDLNHLMVENTNILK